MRLKVRQFQAIPDGQHRQELVLGTQLGRDFINDINVFSPARKQARQDQGNGTADGEAHWVPDVLSKFPEELFDLLRSGSFHDSPP